MNNECIPFYEPGGRLTGQATATVTGKRFLKISGNRQNDIQSITDAVGGGNIRVAPADQYGRIIGVSSYDAASGDKVGVLCTPGMVVPVTAEGSIAAFEQVMVGATGKATALSQAAAVAASLSTGVVGSNNALTWTAKDAGSAGNGISVRLRDPAGNSQSLSVTVNGNDIVVNLATDGGGAITSTATLVKAAIEASAAANSLVSVANTGASTGAGVVAAVAATNLAGGLDPGDAGAAVGVCLTAVADGEDAQIKLY